MSVVKAAAAQDEVVAPTIMSADNGECMRDQHGRRLHHDNDGDDEDDTSSQPIAQHRWWQASAKAVRMSVLDHLERDKARTQVSEQLRVWASEKTRTYSKVCAFLHSTFTF